VQNKWLGEWYDTILYVFFVSGLMIFFLCHWRMEYRVRCAELVVNEFLNEVSAEGRIDREIYTELTERLNSICPEYSLNVYTVEYELKPVYDYISEEKIADYFMNRNVKREKELKEWQQETEKVTEEMMRFQTETNSSILAAEQAVCLPLPEADAPVTMEAVRPVQEVYEGEDLITLCKVISEDKMFYALAEPLQAINSGIVEMRLFLNGEEYKVPVLVHCYPRYVICDKGHEITNTNGRIEETKTTGKINCPYCARIPEFVRCNVDFVKKKAGEVLSAEDLILMVTYLNGNTEVITPASEDWQDTFDEMYCGIQSVCVSYRGITENIIVVSENEGCQKCGNDCNERRKEDYEMFPYCTACMSKTLLFTGEVFEERIFTEMGEFLCYSENRDYALKRGSFVVVCLREDGRMVLLMQKEILQNGEERE